MSSFNFSRLLTVVCLVLTFVLLLVPTAFCQEQFVDPGHPVVTDMSSHYGYPAAELEWKLSPAAGEENIFLVSFESAMTFTGLSVGWDVTAGTFNAGDFSLLIRTRESTGEYGEWLPLPGEYDPEENPSGIYWSELYLTPGSEVHSAFEIQLTPPGQATLKLLKVSLADTFYPDNTWDKPVSSFQLSGFSAGLQPTIITRDQWWGSLPPDQLDAPGWLPQAISITHSVVHHPVTHNNPSDPAQAVRSIWHYHAVTLGWGDIGYNFLIDQHGNIFQGRYNPWLYITDTRAGHAGFSNLKSFGVSLLGQFHPSYEKVAPGLPTAEAIASLEKLTAWRFHQRGLNPLGFAGIDTKQYGFITVPRICGHRDVAATSCPGDSLYVHLPAIRDNVDALVNSYPRISHVSRLSGVCRYETAAKICQAGWTGQSQTVIIARGDDYADALAGVPLAYQLDAPILLTANGQLTDITRQELERLQPSQAIILGGETAVSAEVAESLQDMGLAVKRLAGESRFGTAVQIAREMADQGATFTTAFMTVSTNFADALSASAYAAQLGYPILMTNTASLPESTAAALVELGIDHTIVVGGAMVISEEVFAQLPDPRRIDGDNRYATSMALATEFLPANEKTIYIATGLDFPDAIAGSVLAAKNNRGVLLIEGNAVKPDVVLYDFLTQQRIASVTLFGGFNAVSSEVEAWLCTYLLD